MKKSAYLKVHQDGFSIPGLASFRFSNAPKNIFHFIDACLNIFNKLSANQRAMVVLLSSLIIAAIEAKAEECSSFSGNPLIITYLIQGTSRLKIVGWSPSSSTRPTTLCGYVEAPLEQPDYPQIGCACVEGPSADDQRAGVMFYGINVSPKDLTCITNQINDSCSSNDDPTPWKLILLIFATAFGLCSLGVFVRKYCSANESERNAQRSLLRRNSNIFSIGATSSPAPTSDATINGYG